MKLVVSLKLGNAAQAEWDQCRPAGVLVDGMGVGDVGSVVLEIENIWQQDGMVVVVMTCPLRTIVWFPDRILSRVDLSMLRGR